MTLTVSEASRAYREKRKAKLQRLARLEAALQEIAETWHEQLNPNGWRVTSQRYNPADIARQALAGEGEVQ